MTLGPPGSEEHRVRAAVICLVIGALLVLFAWGNWTFRTSAANKDNSVAATADAPVEATDSARIVRLMPLVLLVALLLFLIFLMGGYVIVRAGRRRRQAAYRRSLTPTASDDVWAMHKPPPDT